MTEWLSGRQRAGQAVGIGALIQQVRFQDRLGDLLDEQWHAVALGDDFVEHRLGQGLAAG